MVLVTYFENEMNEKCRESFEQWLDHAAYEDAVTMRMCMDQRELKAAEIAWAAAWVMAQGE